MACLVQARALFSLSRVAGMAPYTWSASSMPPGLSLDFGTGAAVGFPTQAGTFNTTISVTDSSNVRLTTIQDFSLIVSLAPLQIFGSQGQTSFSLPSGVVGTFYEYDMFAGGGSGSYTWSIAGALPQGISGASQNCNSPTVCFKILGTPTQAGTFPSTVNLRDSLGNVASPVVLSLVINWGTPPQITTTTYDLSNNLATIGAPHNFTFQASGGTPPYQWTFVGGFYDGGIQLSSSGVLSGATTLSNDCSWPDWRDFPKSTRSRCA